MLLRRHKRDLMVEKPEVPEEPVAEEVTEEPEEKPVRKKRSKE